jgi:hypothetical protein
MDRESSLDKTFYTAMGQWYRTRLFLGMGLADSFKSGDRFNRRSQVELTLPHRLFEAPYPAQQTAN